MSRYYFYDNYDIPAEYEKTVPQVFPTTASMCGIEKAGFEGDGMYTDMLTGEERKAAGVWMEGYEFKFLPCNPKTL